MFEAGVKVVEDLCIKTVHEQLFRDKTETFACQRCGKCCEGRGGIVVGPRDLTRLSVHFGLSGEEVLARYAEMMGGKPTLKVGDDGFCMFFKEGRGCTIHPARPSVCRAWPFFRGNLIDEVSFEMAREDCPGIRREASHAQFAHEGFRYLEDYKLRCHDIRTEGRAVIVEEHELPPL
ncbi:MAG: YkgJ family cysteine cluster protein [Mailhella sp.]|nr:YkgJ family cysteine cluster protein [Mailhella sp.]